MHNLSSIMKHTNPTGMKCPACGSPKVVLRGFRQNRGMVESGHQAASLQKKQLFLCRGCDRKFTPDDGYLRMRFSPAVIREAVSLYGKGFSSADVSKYMARKKGVKVSRWTVICWVRRYGKRQQPRGLCLLDLGRGLLKSEKEDAR
jgi:transposase-like protein